MMASIRVVAGIALLMRKDFGPHRVFESHLASHIEKMFPLRIKAI